MKKELAIAEELPTTLLEEHLNLLKEAGVTYSEDASDPIGKDDVLIVVDMQVCVGLHLLYDVTVLLCLHVMYTRMILCPKVMHPQVGDLVCLKGGPRHL